MSCMIRVDPGEMSATASVLQSTAAELADLGSGVQSQCCSCCLPAGIEGEVMAAAAAVESSLGVVAGDLSVQATDLSNRGAVAANDSLASAASSASGPGSMPAAPAGMVWSTIGGDSQDSGVVITQPGESLPAAPAGMVWSVAGGDAASIFGTPEEQAQEAASRAAALQAFNEYLYSQPRVAGPALSFDGGSAAAAQAKALFDITEKNSSGLIGLGDPSRSSLNAESYWNHGPYISQSTYGDMYPHGIND